ncbi:MAG: DUF5132 domain-containing protein [Alphaproteobacteria bacterium]|nr:DUF5132 domain-containing protein [Alphaproteobacteria bacterium]
MALIDDMLKGGTVTGVAVGAAALFLAPTVFPTVGRALRPAAKTVIKGGIMLYRETVSAIGELTTDLVEEARRELQDGAPRAAAVARSTAPTHRESSREKH